MEADYHRAKGATMTPEERAREVAHELYLSLHGLGLSARSKHRLIEAKLLAFAAEQVREERSGIRAALTALWRDTVSGAHDLSDANIARGNAFEACVNAINARGK